MEERCDICGDVGVADALVTCSQCKTSVEHMYCMRTCLEEYPDDWRCEECDPSSKTVSPESYPMQEFRCVREVTKSAKVHASVVQPSKSKKLPNESTRVSFDWEKKVRTGKTKYISVNEAIMLSSGAKQSSFHLKDRANLTSGNSQQLKCHDRVGNSIGQQKQTKNVRGGRGCTATEKRNCNDETAINNVLPELKNLSTTPALDASWKGSFIIHDPKHGGLNDKIQAHPPSQVRKKVYDFSMKMPTVIQFELVPCQKFWINLFPEYFPDRKDIGLYFFPSDSERSVDYISLLESLNLKRLALRKQIDDVELLVFTSALLPRDCQQWKGKYFLWGVFHRLKRITTAYLDTSGLNLSSVQPPRNGNERGCSEEVNMESDMIGLVDVGRLDVAVQRKPHREDHTHCGEESSSTVALPGFDLKIDSDSRHLSSPTRVPSLIVKREPDEGGCSEEINMESDMIGRVDVGRLDVAVQRKPHGEDHTHCGEESSSTSALPGFDLKINSDSRHLSSLTRVPSLIVKREPDEGGCSEEVNMEIDMIGGVDVGRLDVAVQRKPQREDHTCCGEESSSTIALPGLDLKIDSDSRHFSSLTRVPSLIVKRELDVDVPPGFEEAYRLRVRDARI